MEFTLLFLNFQPLVNEAQTVAFAIVTIISFIVMIQLGWIRSFGRFISFVLFFGVLYYFIEDPSRFARLVGGLVDLVM